MNFNKTVYFIIQLSFLELKKQKRAQEKMESELKKMQEKLLQGGINIKDRTTQQDKEIEIKRQKLAEERLKERNVSKNAYLK